MVKMSVPTINEYHKNYNNLDVSYDGLYYKELANLTSDSKAILLSESVLENYKGDLSELIISKTLTPKEQKKYYYSPQVLSYDLYGTTQFWSLLLDLNDMTSAIEFNGATINIYDSRLTTLVHAVLALEEKKRNLNADELSDTQV